MSWDNFSEIYDKELQLLNPEQNKDIPFWTEIIQKYGGPVLELACGSGRITIPIAKAGLRITGLDNSKKMLSLLKNKSSGKYPNMETILSDMTDFDIQRKYNFVLMGYFALNQLLEVEDQLACLRNVYQHMSSNGILGLDVYPCVCEGCDTKKRELLYEIDDEDEKSKILMFTSYKIDRLHGLKHWDDEYIIIDQNGNRRSFHNRISMKDISPEYLKILLKLSGFQIIEKYGSFSYDKIDSTSNNLLYICKKDK